MNEKFSDNGRRNGDGRRYALDVVVDADADVYTRTRQVMGNVAVHRCKLQFYSFTLDLSHLIKPADSSGQSKFVHHTHTTSLILPHLQ